MIGCTVDGAAVFAKDYHAFMTGCRGSEGKAGCVGTSGTGVQIHSCGGRATGAGEAKQCTWACADGGHSGAPVPLPCEGEQLEPI